MFLHLLDLTSFKDQFLDLLLFLIYDNGLYNVSNILDPNMFADDANNFLSQQHINTLDKEFNEN